MRVSPASLTPLLRLLPLPGSNRRCFTRHALLARRIKMSGQLWALTLPWPLPRQPAALITGLPSYPARYTFANNWYHIRGQAVMAGGDGDCDDPPLLYIK